jgi:hypothetical protein
MYWLLLQYPFGTASEVSMAQHSTGTRVLSNPSDQPTIDELDAAICKLARQINVHMYRLLMLVRDFDDRMGWAKWGCQNCAEWLAFRCGLSLSAAREKVRTAQALRELPAVSAAFASGKLSYSKVRALTRVVEYHNEEKLLAYALEVTAAQLEERCREIRNGEPESVGTAWRAWERRALTLRRNEVRGTICISVEVPIGDGEIIAQALERAVEAGEAASGYEFGAASGRVEVRDSAEGTSSPGNGWLAQQADALVAVAKAYLAGDAGGARDAGLTADTGDVEAAEATEAATAARAASVADHYQVVVHVDESALRGSVGRSDLPIETVKRLSCDGSVITVVEDPNGNPLDVGRKRRTVTTALKRALWARDRGCAFPGCHRKRYVDGHHIRHWANGGATSLENTVLLCSHHHRLMHEGGFSMRRDATGALCFKRPDGRAIPRGGYRYEDMTDDFAIGDDPIGAAANPSPEVREPRAAYWIEPRSVGRALTAAA